MNLHKSLKSLRSANSVESLASIRSKSVESLHYDVPQQEIAPTNYQKLSIREKIPRLQGLMKHLDLQQ